MFVTKKDQARATYHMVCKCGRHCGVKDDRGRAIWVLDGRAYAMRADRKTAVCLGNWHDFLEKCRRVGTKFTPVFVWGVNCI